MRFYAEMAGGFSLEKENYDLLTLVVIKLGDEVYNGRAEGIKALVLDNLEDGIPRERILGKLQKRFGLTEEAAIQYFEKFAMENE